MSGVAEVVRCPECGGELVVEPGLPRLCPQCLLSLALQQSPPASSGGDGGSDPEALTVDRPTPGRILGERYQIREVLGRGGMGEVFRAFDLKLRVEVALKAVRAEKVESERAREMLRGEVRSAREVLSPNVCRIFDLVEEDGQELVSMEFVDGETLGDTLKQRGPLTLQEAREIASQFLSGLEAIHQAGLVHRDFKPENVMLTRAGRVVVMDFGLAKARTEGGTGTIAGTPAYMAPEQARGEAVDARADVYSAGVVLAEMLSVGGAGSAEARQAFWRAVRQVPPGVPDGPWAPVLRQALAANPEDRLESARALARALEEVTQRLPGFETKRPYPGLASFTEEDAEFFFGRELEVEALWKKLKRPRMLALVAPSGAGKSSFLRAGLLPTLPRAWKALMATPGNRPFRALARTLVPFFAGDTQATEALLRFEDADTAVSLLQRFRKRHEHALVIVDQFEELFTLNPPEVQAAFAQLLGRLVLEADLHVVLSLRDDFLVRCHESEPLAPATSDLTILKTLGPSALRRALVQPALACGYRFEDEALVDEMVAEVRKEKGALPLLAFAASRLWETRDREQGLLTREAYQEIGGVAGALAQHAEATLERIGTPRTPLVRELFRNLVTAQGTRAVRDREELLSVFGSPRGQADEVLNALVDARLLTSYERAGEGGESRQQVEIIHESLLSAWPRLVRWQTQDADGAQLRDQLRQAAQLWQDRGRTDDLLWSGQAYHDLALWRERYPGGLTAAEEAFARAAAHHAGRQRRRRVAIVTALVAGLSLGLGVVGVFWSRAETARRKAEAGKLLVLGEREIGRYPTAALAYATRSLELADTEPGRLLALRVLQTAPVARIVPVGSGAYTSAPFSPTGEWVALTGAKTVDLVGRDGASRTLVAYEGAQDWTSAAFGPRGDVVATALGGDLRWWSLPDGRESRRARGEEGPSLIRAGEDDLVALTRTGSTPPRWLVRRWPWSGGPSQDLGPFPARDVPWTIAGGRLVYADERRLYRRALSGGGGALELLLTHEKTITSVRLSPDGRLLAVGDGSATQRWEDIRVYSTESHPPRLLRVLQAPGTQVTGIDRHGRRLSASGVVEGVPVTRVFDLEAPPGSEPVALRRTGSNWWSPPGFDPSGEWLATPHEDGGALWWLGEARARVIPTPRTGALIHGLAFSPDGAILLSVSSGGVVRAWPLSGGEGSRVLLEGSAGNGPVLALDPFGRKAAAGFADGSVWVVPLDGGSARSLAGFTRNAGLGAVAFGDGGRLLAAAPRTGPRAEKVVRVFHLDTGKVDVLGPLPGTGDGWETAICGLAFVDTDHLLASVAGTGLVSIDLRSRATRILSKTPDVAFVLRPDRRGGVGTLGGAVGAMPSVAFDLDTGATRTLPAHGNVEQAVLDPTGTVVATGAADGTVRVGPLSGDEPHVFLGHTSVITALAFSPDGRWLASTAEDNTIRLWPVPDVTKAPPHLRPYEELMVSLRAQTNLRAVPDAAATNGYKLEVGPFPGWAMPPEW